MGLSNQIPASRLIQPGVCTSTTRPSSPFEGQVIYETDTDLTYMWSGSAWTQVSGSTAVGNSGLVYITSASATSGTALNVNNVFTASYSAYLLQISGLPASGTYGIDIRMRASGTDAQTGYYWGMSRVDIANASISVDRGNNSSIMATGAVAGTAGRATAVLQVINPQLAQYTSFSSQATDNRSGAGYGAVNSGGQLANTTSYDGFTLLFGGGNGTISYLDVVVYGYRK